MSENFTATGPIFDGRAQQAVRAFLVEASEAVAQEGVNLVRARLGHVLRHRTGHYESRIQTSNAGGGAVVTDGGVVYGPWLEGVSSRNHRSRFKGYATFQKVTAELHAKAGEVADEEASRLVERLS